MRWRSLTFRFLSLLIAVNYFAFRAEFFEDETARNNPQPQSGVSYSFPTLNWETFDKDNAPTAFVFDGHVQFELLVVFPAEHRERFQYYPQFRLVHDKSPPSSPPSI
jgi:hypothetical protein